MSPLRRRLQALVLTLIFLGGGTSLPNADVLLYHLRGETSRTRTHVETTNGCGSHAGHCGVGCPASAAGALGARMGTAPLQTTLASIAPRTLGGTLLLDAGTVGFHSRAPPTLHS